MQGRFSNFPVFTKTARFDLCGVETDIVACCYSDKLLLLITQLGSVATFISARHDQNLEGRSTFSVSCVFGNRDDPLLLVCARRLIETAVDKGCQLPLLVGFGMKTITDGALRELLEKVASGGYLDLTPPRR